jgi:hypothetical protein
LGLAVVAAVAVAGSRGAFSAELEGFQEVPAVSTDGNGTFHARIARGSEEIRWTLSYSDLNAPVQQAHIHLGQESVNGNIVVFLCTNLGNGPAGTQACPPPPATISGTIHPGDIQTVTTQGIATGEFGELVRAMRAGVTYANVHTVQSPGGEVRGQIDRGDDHHGGD